MRRISDEQALREVFSYQQSHRDESAAEVALALDLPRDQVKLILGELTQDGLLPEDLSDDGEDAL
jgi:predicted ArsR family transcriptional regulator